MFMRNAVDKIRRVRHHPSLALYCGRNEGMPPADLDVGMRDEVALLDGTRYYISASDRGVVTGRGPYETQDPEWYFANRGATFHSEQGIVCVPPVESMRAMMPEVDLWPISDMWAIHDYQEPRSRLYTERIEQRYGRPEGIEDYCRKAQMVNLESAKAMFECLQSRQGAGQLVWMTQSAWPALICQIYDYYFEQTAAYFGVKTACEPLHILWDQAGNLVKVANNSISVRENLRADAWIYDLDGREQWHQSRELTIPSATAQECFPISIPASLDRMYFVRLQLTQGSTVLSENFYWKSANTGDCTALNALKQLSLTASMESTVAGEEHVITIKVTNPNQAVALAIRLMLLRGQSEERILPAFYEDNYFSLLPEGEKIVRIRVPRDSMRDQAPRLSVTGWNIKPEHHAVRH
jgi:beta-galactosidase/beta-glucuronidase